MLPSASFIWSYLQNLIILLLVLLFPLFKISAIITGMIEMILKLFHMERSEKREGKIFICIIILFIASVFTVAVPMTKKDIDFNVKFQTVRHLRDSLWDVQEDTLRSVFIRALDDNGVIYKSAQIDSFINEIKPNYKKRIDSMAHNIFDKTYFIQGGELKKKQKVDWDNIEWEKLVF